MPLPDDEYIEAVYSCYLAARMLAKYDLPQVITMIERAETVGPFVDSTLYREKSGHMKEDRGVVEAALKLREFGLMMENRNVG